MAFARVTYMILIKIFNVCSIKKSMTEAHHAKQNTGVENLGFDKYRH